MQGFGGVLAVAQHHLVERERWLTRAEFLELLSAGQVLPGPNIVNIALMVGDRQFGWRGAMAALAGILALPLVIVLLLAWLYAGFASVPAVAGALRGMGAVSAGLVLSNAIKLVPTLRRHPLGPFACALLAGSTLGVIVVLGWPLAVVVLGLGPLAVALAWWCLARREGRA